MKNKLTLFFLLFLFKSLAQAPQSFNYQAIARDKDQKPLANKRLNVDLKILRNGQTIYEEPHQPETAPNGLFTLSVGSIYPSEFQKIDWSDGDYALKVGISGAVTIDVPAEPLLSVPYALFASKIDPSNLQLKIAGNTLSIAGGNSVLLPPGLGGGDNWGDQSVVTGTALTGKGTTASPLNLAAGTTKGQVLKWNGNIWVPAADSVGSTGNGTVYKAGAGIEINTQQNEIKNTGDLDATDDLTDQSSAAGDVSGKFAALSVDKLKGQPLSSAPPSMGQVLKWDGNVWKPDTDLNTVGNGTAATGAPLLGNGAAGDPIRLTPGTAMGQVLKWDGNSWVPAKDEIGTTSGTATIVEVSGTGLSVSQTATVYTLTNTGDTNPADDLTNISQAGGDVQGPFSDLQIKNNAVGTAEIANGAVNGSKIAPLGAASGQVLKWNGSVWAPADDNTTTTTGGSNVGPTLTGDGSLTKPLNLAQQNAQSGQVLKWNGSNWLPAADLGASVLDDLNDVATTGVNTGQVLKWNGTTWAPAKDETGNGTATTVEVSGSGLNISPTATGYTLANTGDLSPTNELQTISLSGAQLSLSNGGGSVTLPSAITYAAGTGISITGTAPNLTIANTGDLSSTNEIQTLSFNSSNNQLSIQGGNTVTLPVPMREIRILEERQDGGGGSATSYFNRRALNTILPNNNSSNISLNPNASTFTLKSGMYIIQATAPAFQVATHQLLLRNLWTDEVELVGTNAYSPSAGDTETLSIIHGVLIIPANTTNTYILDHWVQTPSPSGNYNALGYMHGTGVGTKNIYSRVIIEKIQ